MPSQIPLANDLNSAYALLLATTGCFLLRQVTRLPHTNEQYPDVDRLSVQDPAQSASQYNCMFLEVVLRKHSPFPGDPFRYFNTLRTTSM